SIVLGLLSIALTRAMLSMSLSSPRSIATASAKGEARRESVFNARAYQLLRPPLLFPIRPASHALLHAFRLSSSKRARRSFSGREKSTPRYFFNHPAYQRTGPRFIFTVAIL